MTIKVICTYMEVSPFLLENNSNFIHIPYLLHRTRTGCRGSLVSTSHVVVEPENGTS